MCTFSFCSSVCKVAVAWFSDILSSKAARVILVAVGSLRATCAPTFESASYVGRLTWAHNQKLFQLTSWYAIRAAILCLTISTELFKKKPYSFSFTATSSHGPMLWSYHCTLLHRSSGYKPCEQEPQSCGERTWPDHACCHRWEQQEWLAEWLVAWLAAWQ